MWKQGPSPCDLFKDKIWSEKISFIARKQSWNQSRAAYDRDLDEEIDEEITLDSEINLKFNGYSSEEIEVNPTNEFNVDELSLYNLLFLLSLWFK